MQESLVIEGELGTITNESQWFEPPVWFYPCDKNEKIDLTKDVRNSSLVDQYNISDQRLLDDFYQAITTNGKPICSAEDAFRSVSILEASRKSCESGKQIQIDEIPMELTAKALT